MRQLLTVYARSGRLFLQASSLTTVGVWLAESDFRGLDMGVDDVTLGSAVREGLGSSRSGVPHPPTSDLGKSVQPLINAAGARSWKAFAIDASLAAVEHDDDRWVITVWRRDIDRGRVGFVGVAAKEVTGELTAGELGRYVREAIDAAVAED